MRDGPSYGLTIDGKHSDLLARLKDVLDGEQEINGQAPSMKSTTIYVCFPCDVLLSFDTISFSTTIFLPQVFWQLFLGDELGKIPPSENRPM